MTRRRLYPKLPLVGVGILIQNNCRYLLIKRGAEPDAGLWSIPGGLVEVGESTKEAAVREALEETGLEVIIVELLGVVDKIVKDPEGCVKYHFVIIDYLADLNGGRLKPKDDALEAKWVLPKDFNKFKMSRTLVQLLKKLSLYN